MMDREAVRACYRGYIADVIGIVYNNFVHQVPKIKTIGLLRREKAALEKKLKNISYPEKAFLNQTVNNLYYLISKNSVVELRKINKQVNYQEFIKNRSEVVFEAIKGEIVNSGLSLKLINEGVRIHEEAGKREKIQELLADKEDYTPFCVCDVHSGCAKDHLEYQGKVYYKADWENYITDEEIRVKVRAYIKNHRLMSVEKVTKAPIYLIFRPNCRHELVDIPADEVLNSSVKKILVNHGLIRNNFVDKTEADRAWRGYLDKLELYRELWKVAPNEKLGKELNHTRKLYKKWLNLKKRG